ncbi:hypothetical protein ARMGADRAFT_592215 [Armillaria gallica]|uniref:Uncharacterized protein n=1 Tax=Armillaria gallica TaxID=47427 RepID=A0A2H3D7S2_ARMGA|nr:hypothetical protein ARMGADRAFT_592215 [Armillaria gallica]
MHKASSRVTPSRQQHPRLRSLFAILFSRVMEDWPPTNCTSLRWLPAFYAKDLVGPHATRIRKQTPWLNAYKRMPPFFSTDHDCEHHPHANHQKSAKEASDVSLRVAGRIAHRRHPACYGQLQVCSTRGGKILRPRTPLDGALNAVPSCLSLHLPSPLLSLVFESNSPTIPMHKILTTRERVLPSGSASGGGWSVQLDCPQQDCRHLGKFTTPLSTLSASYGTYKQGVRSFLPVYFCMHVGGPS